MTDLDSFYRFKHPLEDLANSIASFHEDAISSGRDDYTEEQKELLYKQTSETMDQIVELVKVLSLENLKRLRKKSGRGKK